MFLYKNKITWFTLVELMITVTIMSIIIVSVINIFISSNDISFKSDINRSMQKNIKNVVETIAEDVRKNWIAWVANWINTCVMPTWNIYSSWSKLCTWTWILWNTYFLAKKSDIVLSWSYIIADNSDCQDLNSICSIAIKDPLSSEISPLSNSSVSFSDLSFYVSNSYLPKVTIVFKARPSFRKWVKSNLIKDSNIFFQTTISERFIKNY